VLRLDRSRGAETLAGVDGGAQQEADGAECSDHVGATMREGSSTVHSFQ
jgi:hypothetical protein